MSPPSAETGKPNIDLFASAENTQLPVFCTRFHDTRAWVSDALQISWKGMSAYAFPRYLSSAASSSSSRGNPVVSLS